MSILTRNPTNNQTPAIGGTNAVTGINNTGHSATITSASASAPVGSASDADSKSAIWNLPQSFSAQIVEVRLRFNYSATGFANANSGGNDGDAQSSSDFLIEYSTNGGANWIFAVGDSCFATDPFGDSADNFTTGGTQLFDVLLPVSQNIGLVAVRDQMNAFAFATAGTLGGSTASCNCNVTVSNIRVEVTFVDGGVITVGF
jgi:hypothetical protein